jgi:GDP-L-fucose synthase
MTERNPHVPYRLAGKRVWVAGDRGMVGSALVRALRARGDVAVLTVARDDVDLRDQRSVQVWLVDNRPDAIVLAAARVGGIMANSTAPADFLYDNLMIEANVIHSAWSVGVGKLLFLGSSCIYPRLAEQPIREDALLTGSLEPTNQWYALAKIAGLKLCEAFRRQHGCVTAMPTNLFGPGDNFGLESSHVLPALLRRFHDAAAAGAKSVKIWGSGRPRREFLHVDDLAAALILILERYSSDEPINVGVGRDIPIAELAGMIRDTVGYRGRIEFDRSKPDGTPRKLLDITKLIALGWQPTRSLRQGIEHTYRWFLDNRHTLRDR